MKNKSGTSEVVLMASQFINDVFVCCCGQEHKLKSDIGTNEIKCPCGEIWQAPIFPKPQYIEPRKQNRAKPKGK